MEIFVARIHNRGTQGLPTWTRGLAWAMCGFAEEIEWFDSVKDTDIAGLNVKKDILPVIIKAARATCDFYIDNCPVDGVPYWDTGAPDLYKLGDYLNKPADPFNDFEPVDSSAAPIAAQGLLRLGRHSSAKWRERVRRSLLAGRTNCIKYHF